MRTSARGLDGFTVETCRHEDVRSVEQFFTRMRRDRVSFLPVDKTDIFNKYRRYKDESGSLNLFLLKEKDGRIAGCSGYVPFNGMLGGKAVKGFVGSDAVIDPASRAKSPLLAMMLARRYENLVRQEKTFPLICPASKEVSARFRGVQWGQFSYIYKLASDLAAHLCPDIGKSSIELRRIAQFDPAVDEFFRKVSSQHHFLLNCDADFLNWKYFRNPQRNYVVLAATRKNKFMGYIVAEKRFSDIIILDLTVDLENPKVMLLLMFEVFKYLDIGKIDPVVVYLSHKKYIEVMKRAGFFITWEIECLFFKIGLLFNSISQKDFYAAERGLFHFNGYAPHLY